MKTSINIFKYFRSINPGKKESFLKYIFIKITLNILKTWLVISMTSLLLEFLKNNKIDVSVLLSSVMLFVIFIMDLVYEAVNMRFKIASDRTDTLLNLKVYETMMEAEYSEQEKERERYEFAKIAINEAGVLKVSENFQSIIESVINILIAFAALSFVNVYMIIAALIAAALNIAAETYRIRIGYNVNAEMGGTELNMYYARDYLTSPGFAKEIRTNNMENYVLAKLKDSIERFTRIKIDAGIKYLSKFWFVYVLDGILLLVIYLAGIYEFAGGRMEIGYFSVYLGAMTTFIFSILNIAGCGVEVSEYGMYMDVLRDYIGNTREVGGGKKKLQSGSPESFSVEFVNVGFKYPGTEEYILKNISFSVKSGEKIAIVGQNGAGKTTLIKILMRLYRPTEGTILINGTDYLDYPESEVRKIFSAVLQDFGTYAFPINNNISMSEKYDREKIIKVLEDVGLTGKINELEHGGETFITQRLSASGIELSGGQNQKLAMARAIYKNAPIFVFDEPTSALSADSEYEIYNNLKKITGDKTAFFISHKLSSCRLCDKIVVLKDGKIEITGNHDLLMETDNLYSRMFKIQASGFNM